MTEDPPSPEQAVSQTRAWLEGFVIGLGLCPFAQAPFLAGQVSMPVCRASDFEALYREILSLILDFVQAGPDERLTSLVLVPRGMDEFGDYLDLLAELDAALDQSGLRGIVQIASFHPAYRFADTPADDAANYTNRSPVPMFHLIREDHLAAALAAYPDPEAIPERNVRRLRSLDRRALDAWFE